MKRNKVNDRHLSQQADQRAEFARKSKGQLNPIGSTPDRPIKTHFYIGKFRVVLKRMPTHKLYNVYADLTLVGRMVSYPSEGDCKRLAEERIAKGLITKSQVAGYL